MNVKNNILLIEDDEFVSKAYRYFLQKGGFQVDVAKNADEARNHLTERLPDLILLDLIMPHTNGFELLEEFKKKDKVKNIPVIVISNLGQESDMAECERLGAVDYLVKSNFYMKDVIQRIKHHLKERVA